jgi:hypothetical protein
MTRALEGQAILAAAETRGTVALVEVAVAGVAGAVAAAAAAAVLEEGRRKVSQRRLPLSNSHYRVLHLW